MALSWRDSYEFGPFRLDVSQKVLLRGGEPVELAPKTFDTLLLLVENAGRVVEKEAFMRAVWPDAHVEEGNVTSQISILRNRVLKVDGGCRIETVPKRGYRLVAEVRSGLAAVGAGPALLVRETHTTARIIVEEQEAAGTYPRPWERWGGGDSAGARSIAVLPFYELTAGRGGEDFLRLGLADALVTKLSSVRQLAVRPTSAVLTYADARPDPVQAGRELQTDAVLTGCLQRAGDRIRVSVQLAETAGGSTVWAQTFDDRFTNIFAVQDSISAQVAGALALELSGEERRRLARRYTENTEAYQAYMKGRYFLGKRTEEAFRKAVGYFQQAIDADPSYELAYSGLSDVYATLSFYGMVAPCEGYPKAKAAAVRALELDESLAEAHASMGHISWFYELDRAGAERSLRRAVGLKPNYAAAYYWHAQLLVNNGEFDAAFATIARAHELDPLSPIIGTNRAVFHYFARDHERADERFRELSDVHPNLWLAYYGLGFVLTEKGEHEAAVAEHRRAVELAGGNVMSLAGLGHACALAGRREEAQRVLAELTALSQRKHVPPYQVTVVCAGLGDRRAGFEWLERVAEEKDPWRAFAKIDPRLDGLRADPRFDEFLRRVGLTP